MDTLALDRVTQTKIYGPVIWLQDLHTGRDIIAIDTTQARKLARQLQIFAVTGELPAREEVDALRARVAGEYEAVLQLVEMLKESSHDS
jgi:hypothetical protein